ncbi:Acetaldehyde dehydrogenase [Paraburkholderia aspalathi]|uniref:Acetaldehyde dehydrogenase n=1 Tax=Paraburkholderia aspalathi TaxID=1324617 RepID=A0ABN7N6V5_9BURK|nr:acetaldehyde dehydrogenase (acetylating) [Paraburkholderia aspalathi]MBK3823632.1 acetaldehyde dehydrogenase (acetylating) [Paraburkholderia aspalathi]MBK3835486.1 acetaldehyde dehydrogenase (acetylating) [Paraburkholderia aspalathi]MBK3865240.1 acetaldehyde dehydrogenase (acetylating) [Paraburkholderia aspalathi]CAE6853063.1 Acetaldehyde dehydrogenase [Paraburkholderia aspalathi]
MKTESPRTRVAILGSGSIGIDLMFKVNASRQFDLAFVVGRSAKSEGLGLARDCHVDTSSDGIDFLKEHADEYDLVFDATSAAAHTVHNRFFAQAGKFVIDLTPAKVGRLCVPCINLPDTDASQNVNLITCGGQASLPLAYALKQAVDEIDYIEVVSAIASRSAGLATRENINEYMTTTEYALAMFSGAKKTKAILNINPAEPGIKMQTTLYAHARYRDFGRVRARVHAMVERVREYVPGYQLVVDPLESHGRITVSLTVRGRGDYLPEYAGNLDIINCAALAVASHRHTTVRPGATQ